MLTPCPFSSALQAFSRQGSIQEQHPTQFRHALNTNLDSACSECTALQNH